MTTECNQFVFGFHPQKRREIRAQFDGGAISGDGGGLLLREVKKRNTKWRRWWPSESMVWPWDTKI
jgi:hypothetical protein